MDWLYKNSKQFEFQPNWLITCCKNLANISSPLFILRAFAYANGATFFLGVLTAIGIIQVICAIHYAMSVGIENNPRYLDPSVYLKYNTWRFVAWVIPSTYIDLLFVWFQKVRFDKEMRNSKTFKLEKDLGLYEIQKALFNSSLEISKYSSLITECNRHISRLEAKSLIANRMDSVLREKIAPELDLRLKNLCETRVKLVDTLRECKNKESLCQTSAESFKDIIDLADIVSELQIADEFLSKTKACLEATSALATEVQILTRNTKKDLQAIIQN